jgi:predicted GIY-YIG superfamily endonuclease
LLSKDSPWDRCPGIYGKCHGKGGKSKKNELCHKCQKRKNKISKDAIAIPYAAFHSKYENEIPCWVYVLRLNDGVYYVGQTKDIRKRIEQHTYNPNKTIVKHGGMKDQVKSVEVTTRSLAEQMEQFIFELMKDIGIRVTKGLEEAT